jgi:hypothetical protein
MIVFPTVTPNAGTVIVMEFPVAMCACPIV